RLGEFLLQLGIRAANEINVSSRLRCLRTKTGTAYSALRPFTSQGHLIGMVDRLFAPKLRIRCAWKMIAQLRRLCVRPFTRLHRFRGTAVYGMSPPSPASVRLDACELHHLAPLLGFVGDKLTEIGRRTGKNRAARIGNPRLDLGVGESCVGLLVELVDDLGGHASRCAEA